MSETHVGTDGLTDAERIEVTALRLGRDEEEASDIFTAEGVSYRARIAELEELAEEIDQFGGLFLEF